MIKTCPLCDMDTAGTHEWDCPNKPSVVSIGDGVTIYKSTGACQSCARLHAQTASIMAENKRFKEFAQYVIRTECWGGGFIDGGDVQGLAERLDLIVPHIATEDDVDDESDYEVGDKIFKFSEALKDTP